MSAFTIKKRQYSTSNRILLLLISIATFFTPLNGLPYIWFLGEFSYEAAFYPMVIAVAIFGILTIVKKDRIVAPRHKPYKLLTLFLFWVITSGILNFPAILMNFTKGRSGVEKFSLQFILLLFMFITSLITYTALRSVRRSNILFIFRRWVLFSFLFAGIYSLTIEIPAKLGQGWAISSLQFLSPILYNSGDILYTHRLRSLSSEASMFGVYLAFVSPWLLSYYYSLRKAYRTIHLMLMAYVFVLTYLTYSRAAYVIISIEFFVFTLVIFLYGTYRHRQLLLVLLFISTFFVGAIIIGTDIGDKIAQVILSLFRLNAESGLSNIGRGGAQIAAMRMGVDHPLAGVGFGQYGFYLPDYVPVWAWSSWEINLWSSSSPGTPWAPSLGLWSRILGETGFVGLYLWFAVWATTLSLLWKHYLRSYKTDLQNSILTIALMVSILGLMLSGLVVDTLRSFSYWVTFGVTWAWLTKQTDMQYSIGDREK